jgi:hypothetical protein
MPLFSLLLQAILSVGLYYRKLRTNDYPTAKISSYTGLANILVYFATQHPYLPLTNIGKVFTFQIFK